MYTWYWQPYLFQYRGFGLVSSSPIAHSLCCSDIAQTRSRPRAFALAACSVPLLCLSGLAPARHPGRSPLTILSSPPASTPLCLSLLPFASLSATVWFVFILAYCVPVPHLHRELQDGRTMSVSLCSTSSTQTVPAQSLCPTSVR